MWTADFEQVEEIALPFVDGVGVEHIHGISEEALDFVSRIHHVQSEIEMRADGRHGEALDAQAAKIAERGGREAIIELHLEQRIMREPAFGPQNLDQPFERQVLIGVGARDRVLHLGQQRRERNSIIDLAAQHQRIDEKADQPFGRGAAAICEGRADAQIALAAAAMEQNVKCA